MPKSPRKKQKTTHYQRSGRNRIAVEQSKLEQTDVEQHGNKLTLFGKCIAVDEQDQRASHYAKLRFWFRHAIPQRGEDSPLPRILDTSIQMCSAPSNARKSHRDSDVPSKDETGIFQKIPPPLPAQLPPYPTMTPFIRDFTLEPTIINDPNCMLEQHIEHWKKVRKNWVLHRQLYLQRYKPCFDFIYSTSAQPVDE